MIRLTQLELDCIKTIGVDTPTDREATAVIKKIMIILHQNCYGTDTDSPSDTTTLQRIDNGGAKEQETGIRKQVVNIEN